MKIAVPATGTGGGTLATKLEQLGDEVAGTCDVETTLAHAAPDTRGAR